MRHFRQSIDPSRPAASSRQPGIAGRWRDANGSILELEIAGSSLNGLYHVDFENSGELDAYELTGTACGDFLAFTVDLSPHGVLAAFVGQAFPAGMPPEGLHLVWLLTEKADGPDQAGAILSGEADFRRTDDQ
jgi:Avidin family.